MGLGFLPNFWFLSHNFCSKYVRKSINGSKFSDNSQVSKKNFEPKIACWVCAKGKVTSVRKARKPSPIMTSPTRMSKPKSKNFLKIQTRRFPEYVDGLNSYLAQSAGELWSWKVSEHLAKKWRARDLKSYPDRFFIPI